MSFISEVWVNTMSINKTYPLSRLKMYEQEIFPG